MTQPTVSKQLILNVPLNTVTSNAQILARPLYGFETLDFTPVWIGESYYWAIKSSPTDKRRRFIAWCHYIHYVLVYKYLHCASAASAYGEKTKCCFATLVTIVFKHFMVLFGVSQRGREHSMWKWQVILARLDHSRVLGRPRGQSGSGPPHVANVERLHVLLLSFVLQPGSNPPTDHFDV